MQQPRRHDIIDSQPKEDPMLDDKFHAELETLITAFLEGGGSRETAVRALDGASDELWQQDLEAGGWHSMDDWPTDDGANAED